MIAAKRAFYVTQKANKALSIQLAAHCRWGLHMRDEIASFQSEGTNLQHHASKLLEDSVKETDNAREVYEETRRTCVIAEAGQQAQRRRNHRTLESLDSPMLHTISNLPVASLALISTPSTVLSSNGVSVPSALTSVSDNKPAKKEINRKRVPEYIETDASSSDVSVPLAPIQMLASENRPPTKEIKKKNVATETVVLRRASKRQKTSV